MPEHINKNDKSYIFTIIVSCFLLTVIVQSVPAQPDPGREPLFALKTNLLFDLATALNIEIEVPVGDRWSIAGEYIFPWWLWENKQYCFQMLAGNLEGRYWPGDRTGRKRLTGWFTGIYGGGGYYDVERKDKGYQGHFFSVGLTGGYAHPIGKNLRMEYSIGLGYFNSNYDEYFPVRGADDKWHLIREKSDRRIWGGPTRIKVSLVWMLHDRFWKKGGSK